MSRSLTLSAAFAVLVAFTGCGSGFTPVSGTVTLDGVPVEGATVVFTSEDGGKSYSGFTDASGAFSLKSGEKEGATPGNYKVTVTRTKSVAGAEGMAPGGADYMKQMKAQQKQGSKETKSELPQQYSKAESTPIKVTVPVSEPVKIELKK